MVTMCEDPMELDWARTETLNSSHRHLFLNKSMSDVEFVCKDKENNEHLIPAHRVLLSCRSKVFHAMFYGLCQDQSEKVEIVDINKDILTELIRYLYYDEACISMDNALSLLYAAKKYFVPSLEKLCVNYVIENLAPHKVCDVLSHLSHFIEDDIFEKCLEYVDKNALDVMKQNGFYDLGQEVLHRIFIRDSLAIGEYALFQCLEKWASQRCEEKELEKKPSNVRKVIGNLILDIRFTQIPVDIFADEISLSGILTDEEIVKIFQYHLCSSKPELEFCTKARVSSSHEICRFPTVDRVCGWYCQGPDDAIEFCTDHDIYLKGIGIYGPCDQQKTCSYMASIRLFVEDDKQIFLQTYKFLGQDDVFHGLMESPLAIKRGVWYCVAAKIIGPRSVCGMEGSNVVNAKGIRFEFRNSLRSKNHTEVSRGQIASFIFHYR